MFEGDLYKKNMLELIIQSVVELSFFRSFPEWLKWTKVKLIMV